MSYPIGFKNPEWDLSKSKYAEIDDYLMMQTPGPVLMILAAYLLFVLKAGPAFMRKREAFKLTSVLVWYNAVQVVLSLYLMQKYLRGIYVMGLVPSACFIERDDMRSEIISGIWWYLAAKITELLDTVFFVFRKKDGQISFLHLYHHTIMAIGTWAMLKYSPSHLLFFIGFLNSLVHVVMYSYYGLAAFGDRFAKYLTWKKYITTMQLVQFVMIVLQYLASVKSSECPPSKGIAIFVATNTTFILFLFLNFYRQNYNNKRSKRGNGKVIQDIPEVSLAESEKAK